MGQRPSVSWLLCLAALLSSGLSGCIDNPFRDDPAGDPVPSTNGRGLTDVSVEARPGEQGDHAREGWTGESPSKLPSEREPGGAMACQGCIGLRMPDAGDAAYVDAEAERFVVPWPHFGDSMFMEPGSLPSGGVSPLAAPIQPEALPDLARVVVSDHEVFQNSDRAPGDAFFFHHAPMERWEGGHSEDVLLLGETAVDLATHMIVEQTRRWDVPMAGSPLLASVLGPEERAVVDVVERPTALPAFAYGAGLWGRTLYPQHAFAVEHDGDPVEASESGTEQGAGIATGTGGGAALPFRMVYVVEHVTSTSATVRATATDAAGNYAKWNIVLDADSPYPAVVARTWVRLPSPGDASPVFSLERVSFDLAERGRDRVPLRGVDGPAALHGHGRGYVREHSPIGEGSPASALDRLVGAEAMTEYAAYGAQLAVNDLRGHELAFVDIVMGDDDAVLVQASLEPGSVLRDGVSVRVLGWELVYAHGDGSLSTWHVDRLWIEDGYLGPVVDHGRSQVTVVGPGKPHLVASDLDGRSSGSGQHAYIVLQGHGHGGAVVDVEYRVMFDKQGNLGAWLRMGQDDDRRVTLPTAEEPEHPVAWAVEDLMRARVVEIGKLTP